SFPGAKVVFQFSFTEQLEFDIKQPNINYMHYCEKALPMARDHKDHQVHKSVCPVPMIAMSIPTHFSIIFFKFISSY
ncbi:hypothetical protein, partial [Mariniflexile sp.]|uniref:hypothetical protein n=1 Tax=Mariniflexile sp. TaxID=1979402 RepID=UPI0040473025